MSMYPALSKKNKYVPRNSKDRVIAVELLPAVCHSDKEHFWQGHGRCGSVTVAAIGIVFYFSLEALCSAAVWGEDVPERPKIDVHAAHGPNSCCPGISTLFVFGPATSGLWF